MLSCIWLFCDPVDYTYHACSWDSSGKNTGVDSHSLLEISPTQGLSPGLLHFRQICYCLRHQGSPPLCFVLLLCCRSSLYILEINPLSDLWFVIVFSHSIGCLFAIVSFIVQKSFSLIQSHLLILAFVACALENRAFSW